MCGGDGKGYIANPKGDQALTSKPPSDYKKVCKAACDAEATCRFAYLKSSTKTCDFYGVECKNSLKDFVDGHYIYEKSTNHNMNFYK